MAEAPRRKVLVISYYWPPSGGSGVQRWLKIVKYLHKYGWEPIVYTPENPEYPELDHTLYQDIPEEVKIIRQPIWEPYSFYKKIVGLKKNDKIGAGFLTENKKIGVAQKISVWLRGNFFIPDARKYWIKPSIRFLSQFLLTEPVDAIVSTGPPHSMHLIAEGVHQRTGIPWLADFCDPWTSIDFYDQLRLTRLADKKHRALEQKVIRSADAVAVVTRTMASDFEELYSRDYDIVTNGFDETDIHMLQSGDLDKKFSISHIGSLVPSRNPSVLWETLACLIQENTRFAEDLEIKLVGKVDISVLESIKNAGLTRFLRKINYLQHNEALIETQKSQLLLLLINQTPNAKGIVTGKLFEYLAVKRPILCLGPVDGDASLILAETQSGATCDYSDPELLKKNILEFYKKYLTKSLVNENTGIARYSWQYLSGEVAAILERITISSKVN